MKRNIFTGRYGFDQFSFFMLILAILFLLIKNFWPVSVLFAVFVLFRAFSKNIGRRQRELWAYNGVLTKISLFFRKRFAFLMRFYKRMARGFKTIWFKWHHRKENIFPRCPKCHSILRLPRGKGTLLVTCSVCGHEFKVKT